MSARGAAGGALRALCPWLSGGGWRCPRAPRYRPGSALLAAGTWGRHGAGGGVAEMAPQPFRMAFFLRTLCKKAVWLRQKSPPHRWMFMKRCKPLRSCYLKRIFVAIWCARERS